MRTTADLGRLALPMLVALPLALSLEAQQWESGCEGRDMSTGTRARYCDVRDQSLSPTGRLAVDARPNGGVTVVGWEEDRVAVRAVLVAHADTEDRARALAGQIQVIAESGRIESKGPSSGDDEHWSVSYEIYVPHQQDLTLESHNGGVEVAGVLGRMDLRTRNGGVALRDLSGQVRARTTNGGLAITLTGPRWEGAGLDAETTNGGITLEIPEGYSATLETGTVNGGLEVDFPMTVQGKISKRLTLELGGGGPPIRAVTTNGGVRIERD